MDSPLEGGVSCELVSESQPKPLAAFILFYFATLKRGGAAGSRSSPASKIPVISAAKREFGSRDGCS